MTPVDLGPRGLRHRRPVGPIVRWPTCPPPRISFITSVAGRSGARRRQRQNVDVLERLHHAQLAMLRGEESAARAFYAGVLGMIEISKPPSLAARGRAWFPVTSSCISACMTTSGRPQRPPRRPRQRPRSARGSLRRRQAGRHLGRRPSRFATDRRPRPPSETAWSSCSRPGKRVLCEHLAVP